MRQSIGINLNLSTQLRMTPQLQQAIRLLQLSSLDLQTEIQTVLDSNLMLEKVDETQTAEPVNENSSNENSSNEINGSNNSQDSEVKIDGNTPDELPVDSNWDDVYEVYDGSTSYSRNDDNDSGNLLEQRTSNSESLQDYLSWQMELTPFSETDYAIAEAIIDAVGNSGYLSQSLEDILIGLQQSLPELEMDEVEAVLHRIQRFDPPGIAARNVSECLLLQLEQLPKITPWRGQALVLVRDHLERLASHDFNSLMRKLKVTREQLSEIVNLIQSLKPHPGVDLATDETEYIAPDVYVFRNKNTWRVELNPEHAPKIQVNKQYSSLIKRADKSADNVCLQNHLQEAKWFINSLQKRNETLLGVAICIVEHQRDFFEFGEEHMKPLVLRDIAEAMEMHESTISRVTTQKYMHTPRGIFEFKYFFSSRVGTNDGGEASSVAIHAKIKKLIDEESGRKPLSDSKLAQLLSLDGFQVARRTVAKYREQMSIPSSSERKQLV